MMANDRHSDEYGRLIVTPAAALELLYQNDLDALAHVFGDATFATYNAWCKQFDKPELCLDAPPPLTASPEEYHAQRQQSWNMPEEYRSLDVAAWLHQRCKLDSEHQRVDTELALFELRNLMALLRFLVFFVDKVRAAGLWWGVGRGSSVASYCLYLIGVHKIDSIRYGLDIREFLK